MGTGDTTTRPIWRKPLAAVLVAWMLMVLGATLSSARIMELAPPEAMLALVATVYLAPIPVLLVWSFWAMMRDPVTGWIAPTALLTFGFSLIPAFQPLLDASVRLNFADHRPAYEAIVADVSMRKPSGRAGANDWVDGVRDEVRYRYRPDRPGEIDFIWAADPQIRAGVRYDNSPCVPAPGVRCIDRGRPLAKYYSYYQRIF